MSRKKTTDNINIPLLKTIQEGGARNPGMWDYLDKQMQMKEQTIQTGEKWPDWCVFPADLMLKHIRNWYTGDTQGLLEYSYIMSAFQSWRHSKEVFIVDDTLLEELTANSDLEAEIPASIFYRLPYPAFYIKFPDHYLKEMDIDGLLVTLTRGYIDINDPTVYDVMCVIMVEPDGNWKRTPGLCPLDDARLCFENKTTADFFQMILYLISQNSDVQPNKTQKTVYRRDKTIKDRYSEMRQWDVGVRLGAAIRQARTSTAEGETVRVVNTGSGSPKRPHMRRAHWSHFWTGPKDKPEERKLILKWIPPIAINADIDTASPAVVHYVEGE